MTYRLYKPWSALRRYVPIARMSSPHEVAPFTFTRVSVPLPASSALRQRHSTFFESRMSRSRPPTASWTGVAAVAPAAFCPARMTTVALRFFRSIR